MQRLDHRQARALERYGAQLSLDDIAALEAQVSPSNLVKRNADGGTVHAVMWASRAWVVGAIRLADGTTRITTFLPPDSLRAGNHVRWLKGKNGGKRPRSKKPL